jgi:hypothetical protein
MRSRNAHSKSGPRSWTYPPDGVSPAFVTWPSVTQTLLVLIINYSWRESVLLSSGSLRLFWSCVNGHSHSASMRLALWISRMWRSSVPSGRASDRIPSLTSLSNPEKLRIVSKRGSRDGHGRGESKPAGLYYVIQNIQRSTRPYFRKGEPITIV